MTRSRWILITLLMGLALGSAAQEPVVNGRPLGEWVLLASDHPKGAEAEKTVDALTAALELDDLMARVKAMDAMALMGPAAKKAAPALIQQLTMDQPWVRAAAMGAVASMGKDAVPFIITAMQGDNETVRIRSAFILGSIGPMAHEAVPYLEGELEKESEANRVRFLGLLGQIDPDKYGETAAASKASFDPDAAKDDGMGMGIITDWPRFHGPNHDSTCREIGLLKEWPEEGPKRLWQINGLGMGYSTVSIADERILTMGDLEMDGEQKQCVIALSLADRRVLWRTPIGPPHSDGPRCTPTIDGDRVYVIGTEGDWVCLKALDGSILWRRNMVSDFGGKMMSGWKFSESPLIDGDRVIGTPGGPDADMVALDKMNGKTIWKLNLPDLGDKGADGAGYASAVPATIAGVRQIVQITGRGAFGVEAETGRFLWGYNRIANNIANIPSPVIRGDYVFLTTGYNTGASLLKIVRAGDQFEAQEVYFIRPNDFQNHHGGVVLVGDYIYAGHGPNRGDPACVELSTGKVIWKERSPARGSAGVLVADGHLIFRYDRGDVLLVEATPEAFRIKGRFKTPESEGPAWAHPVIHKGLLYLRHGDIMTCYDLRSWE